MTLQERLSALINAIGADIKAINAALGGKVASSGGTASGLTINGGYTEATYTIPSSTTPSLNPANGTIQIWTLTGNSTPTAASFQNGQSMTLYIDDGTNFTITWPSVTWKTNGGTAPTLNTTGYTVVTLQKVGGVLYGWRGGNA